MDIKKMTIGLAGIAISCALFAGSSYAATSWAACTPVKIGPAGDIVRIQVAGCTPVDPSAGKDGWLTLNATGTDQMMATILTAMSLTKPIGVGFDGTKDAEGYNYATSIMFNNQ
jgi:hypothetical protein